jgi:hypothetical protein
VRSLLLAAAAALTMCGCGSGEEERDYNAIANELGPEGCSPDDATCLMQHDKNTIID